MEVKMYSDRIKAIADEIENLRLKIYSELNIDDQNDKSELDDELFAVQSKLRYEIIDILKCYEQ